MSTKTTALDAPITSVTLLQDRAYIVRRAMVRLDAGSTRLVVTGVAPAISDKTLDVSVVAKSGARINDARIRRGSAAAVDASDNDPQTTEKELERLNAERARLLAEQEILEQQQAGLDKVANLTMAEIAEDAAAGIGDREQWAARMDEIRAAESGLPERACDLQEQLARVSEKSGAILPGRATARENTRATAIVVDVGAETKGEVEIKLEYVVPGASWRPAHRARLLSVADDAEVHFNCDAAVWQNTGEDWSNVELCVSTERSSGPSLPPRLRPTVVRSRKQGADVTSRTVPPRPETIVPSELPSVDDGGETQRLRVIGKVTVPSDGHPHRVPLYSFPTEATTQLVLDDDPTPKLNSQHSNDDEYPILAGPVDLIRDNGFVGRAFVGYVAKGAAFQLTWGPDATVRARRYGGRLYLSNISPETKHVTVEPRKIVTLAPFGHEVA